MNTFENEQVSARLIGLMQSDLPTETLREQFHDFHENDIAKILDDLSLEERQRLYQILGIARTSEVFTYLDDVGRYMSELDDQFAAHIIDNMDVDDAMDIFEELDSETRERIIRLTNSETREDLALISSYDEVEVGSQMTTNYIEIRKDLTIKQAMRELITQAKENDNISTIYVKDGAGLFCGAIDLKDLIIAREYMNLSDLISTSYPAVHAHEKMGDCLEELKDYGEDSIPVLNEHGILIGAITSQDIVEAVDDEMGDDYAKLAGLTAEEDLTEPLKDSMKKRLPWLIVLLLLGMVVSTVVGMFEGVVSQIALIVCFQSLILDMAGNVGTQSLAVTIRVLMDEQLSMKQKLQLMIKEIRIGLFNGLLLGVVSFLFIGLYIALFKGKSIYFAFAISGCVGVSLLVAMIISSFVGTIVPMFFHKIHIDPAVASGPLITTVNDLVAVVTYYGLAWLLLIQLFQLA